MYMPQPGSINEGTLGALMRQPGSINEGTLGALMRQPGSVNEGSLGVLMAQPRATADGVLGATQYPYGKPRRAAATPHYMWGTPRSAFAQASLMTASRDAAIAAAVRNAQQSAQQAAAAAAAQAAARAAASAAHGLGAADRSAAIARRMAAATGRGICMQGCGRVPPRAFGACTSRCNRSFPLQGLGFSMDTVPSWAWIAGGVALLGAVVVVAKRSR